MAVIGKALGWLALLNSAVILSGAMLLGQKGFEAGGLFGNASMNASLMLSMTPFITRPVLWLLPLSAALITTRTTPLLIASMLVLTALYMELSPTQRRKFLPSIACLVIAGLAFLAHRFTPYMNNDKASLFNDSGRFDIWRMGAKLWWHQYGWAGRIWGFGPGVSAVWLPQAQQETHTAELAGFWLWWHNDYLQFIFDFGVLGCLTVLPLVRLIYSKWQSISNPLKLSLMALALSAAGNYPLRMASGAFLGAYLIAVITMKGKQNESN